MDFTTHERFDDMTVGHVMGAYKVVKRNGMPVNFVYNGLLKVLFLDYTFGVIGIETDGYAHM
jgi:hypothetical protein